MQRKIKELRSPPRRASHQTRYARILVIIISLFPSNVPVVVVVFVVRVLCIVSTANNNLISLTEFRRHGKSFLVPFVFGITSTFYDTGTFSTNGSHVSVKRTVQIPPVRDSICNIQDPIISLIVNVVAA